MPLHRVAPTLEWWALDGSGLRQGTLTSTAQGASRRARSIYWPATPTTTSMRCSIRTALTLWLLAIGPVLALRCANAPLLDAFGKPGDDAQKCSGAQVVATKSALCVWGICGGGAGVVNRTVWLRKSTDWGTTWLAPVPQPHLGAGDLGQFIYDPKTDTILSMSPPPGPFPRGGPCLPSPGCAQPFSCMSKSTDDGTSWTIAEAVGCHTENQTGSTGEGCGGITLSTGDILAPAGRKTGAGNFVIISQDSGRTWKMGNATPPLPSKQAWGEAMVAELANGSVVLTSRLSGVRKTPHWEFLPIQRGFSISHTGGRTWAKSWSFPADQPFDRNFGPGYNVEHGLASAHNRTRLVLSKPTATLRGDSSGKRPACGPHTQGSCAYRRNLTVASSTDGGASWAIEPWGLIYKGRAAYSDLVELPNGQIAVVFERSNSSLEEYRYVSVAVVTPSWLPR